MATMGKRYLITGGAGFTGCNFAQLLNEEGAKVTLLDNLSRKGAAINLKWLGDQFGSKVRFVHADVRSDFSILCEEAGRADTVIHLAGQVAVTTSVANPRQDFEINAVGTYNLLEAVRAAKNPPILIYSSTNKVYGNLPGCKTAKKGNRYTSSSHPEGVGEEAPLDFHSPYGCSKGAADQYVRDYSRIYGLRTVVMRQSCIYGPRQFGVEDQGWLAWFTIASLLGHEITIYGDGCQVRDTLHVRDLFQAYRAAEKNIAEVTGEVFNIGGGPKNAVSLHEFLELLAAELGQEIPVKYADWRPGDQAYYVSDIRKAKRQIGWHPQISVRDGIKDMIRWVQENRTLFLPAKHSPKNKATHTAA
jgi:CDP-paratose 2-epimerase